MKRDGPGGALTSVPYNRMVIALPMILRSCRASVGNGRDRFSGGDETRRGGPNAHERPQSEQHGESAILRVLCLQACEFPRLHLRLDCSAPGALRSAQL